MRRVAFLFQNSLECPEVCFRLNESVKARFAHTLIRKSRGSNGHRDKVNEKSELIGQIETDTEYRENIHDL